jgi:hypothetical protein
VDKQVKLIETAIEKTESLLKRSTNAEIVQLDTESLSHSSYSATETKFSYPFLFAQFIVSNALVIMVNFIFVKT